MLFYEIVNIIYDAKNKNKSFAIYNAPQSLATAAPGLSDWD